MPPKKDTPLTLESRLPLTCTRKGTCCHGNVVRVTPWESARLARLLDLDHPSFVARFCTPCGTRLAFDGPLDHRQKPACRLYHQSNGCSAHLARPLACRLFPLARKRQSDRIEYFHQGPTFPCLSGCPEVTTLADLTVGDYVLAQDTVAPEAAQDAYLELVSDLADGALVLLLDSGLAASGDRRTLPAWRRLGETPPESWSALQILPTDWLQWRAALLTPDLPFDPDPTRFAKAHADLLQTRAQSAFGMLSEATPLVSASVTMMALSLLLAHTVGAPAATLAAEFCRTATSRGARG
jgi:Fe-S-cluster containining protein